jgi:hypothetical protein
MVATLSFEVCKEMTTRTMTIIKMRRMRMRMTMA